MDETSAQTKIPSKLCKTVKYIKFQKNKYFQRIPENIKK